VSVSTFKGVNMVYSYNKQYNQKRHWWQVQKSVFLHKGEDRKVGTRKRWRCKEKYRRVTGYYRGLA